MALPQGQATRGGGPAGTWEALGEAACLRHPTPVGFCLWAPGWRPPCPPVTCRPGFQCGQGSTGPAQDKQPVWAGAGSALTRTEEWRRGSAQPVPGRGALPSSRLCPRAGEGGRKGRGGQPSGVSGASTAPALWTAGLAFPRRVALTSSRHACHCGSGRDSVPEARGSTTSVPGPGSPPVHHEVSRKLPGDRGLLFPSPRACRPAPAAAFRPEAARWTREGRPACSSTLGHTEALGLTLLAGPCSGPAWGPGSARRGQACSCAAGQEPPVSTRCWEVRALGPGPAWSSPPPPQGPCPHPELSPSPEVCPSMCALGSRSLTPSLHFCRVASPFLSLSPPVSFCLCLSLCRSHCPSHGANCRRAGGGVCVPPRTGAACRSGKSRARARPCGDRAGGPHSLEHPGSGGRGWPARPSTISSPVRCGRGGRQGAGGSRLGRCCDQREACRCAKSGGAAAWAWARGRHHGHHVPDLK